MGDSYWTYMEFKEKDYPFFKEVLREKGNGRVYEFDEYCERFELEDGVYSLETEISGSTLNGWIEILKGSSLSFNGRFYTPMDGRFNFSCFEGFYREIEATEGCESVPVIMKDGEIKIPETAKQNALEYFKIDEDVRKYLTS